MDQRAYLAQVEAASVDEFAEMVHTAEGEQEQTLRTYFGPARFARLRQKAGRVMQMRALVPRGNVVVLPGLMGSEMTSRDRRSRQDLIWLNYWQIFRGRLGRLRLAADGRSSYDPDYVAFPSGILKKFYADLELSLRLRGWNVREFWYDWRRDLDQAADELDARTQHWFGPEGPFHMVAHSMGGLVARMFLKKYKKRWEEMKTTHRSPTRLVMIGTPNHGAFMTPQALTGLANTVRKLRLLDVARDIPAMLEIINSFPGLYQLLPSPVFEHPALKELSKLYEGQRYRVAPVSQRHLDRAQTFHQELIDAIDKERMTYLAGYNQATVTGISNFEELERTESYRITYTGDGTVPLSLGLLREPDGNLVDIPIYYFPVEHVALAEHPDVIKAADEVMQTGRYQGVVRAWGRAVPAAPREAELDLDRQVEADDPEARAVWHADREAELERMRMLIDVTRARDARAIEEPPDTITYEQRQIEDLLAQDFVGLPGDVPVGPIPDDKLVAPRIEAVAARVPTGPGAIPEIRLAIQLGQIHATDELAINNAPPIDVIAVGHYLGEKPQHAEKALDEAISRALLAQQRREPRGEELREAERLLTQLSDRGTIRGELGQTFFLPDPRDPARLVAIVGMGVAGRFGVPELTVAVRELCWAAGRLGKRHLATTRIGTRNANLSVDEAIHAWVRGLKAALTGEDQILQQVTFVVDDPRHVPAIAQAIQQAQADLHERRRMTIHFTPPTDDEYENMREQLERILGEETRRKVEDFGPDAPTAEPRPPATQVVFSLDRSVADEERGVYRFGAVTESASIPERELPLDPRLVAQVSQELIAERIVPMQQQRGEFLGRLVIPSELRDHLRSPSPVVMMLDATTARIPWEMVALPEVLPLPPSSEDTGAGAGSLLDFGADREPSEAHFLALARGFTRRLRTTFAPPPEPPPPARRRLRALIVADPAADAPLLGAQREGLVVAELLERFNDIYADQTQYRIEVVPLIGPREATLTNVLRELMLRTYDIVHYAGHAFFDEERPERSGWLFADEPRVVLSAHELRRIDRVPHFVFANACESGITPDRAEARSEAMVPSFAEAFFERGVSNFVCTAWPISDLAALRFAQTLYAGLLGLKLGPDDPESGAVPVTGPMMPQTLHQALRDARLALFRDPLIPGGALTWGAYQHYGNPYYAFFDGTALRSGDEAKADTPRGPSRRGSRRPKPGRS